MFSPLKKAAIHRGLYNPQITTPDDYADDIIETFDYGYDKSDPHYFTRIWGHWFGEIEIGLGIESRAQRHSADAFVYRNCAQPMYSKSEEHAGTLELRPKWSKCDHGDCYNYLFGLPFFDENAQNVIYTESEKHTSYKMMVNWTNFMRTGKPSSDWPSFQSSGKRMEILPDSWQLVEPTELDKKRESYFEKHIRPFLAKPPVS